MAAVETPFRYPGAKNRLISVLMNHLDKILDGATQFSDVFVGGGSVLLAVAKKYPNIQLFANDKDYWMYCFWKVVAGTDSNKLAELLDLVAIKPTLELFYKLREEETNDEIKCAYKAIFFNRTTFSGILYSGPIGGKGQKSKYTIDCRYNPDKLKKKILNCNKLLAGRTEVENKDFSDYEILTKTNCHAYLDPPYYHKGNVLYIEKMNEFQHEQLSEILHKRSNWILSYDDCIEVRNLYQQHQLLYLMTRYSINGKKDNWESKRELIISP